MYMMFTHSDRLLNDEELNKISSESDFICIEKNHGLTTLGDAVLGLKHEANAFKGIKPEITVLGYFNAARAFPFTRYTESFRDENLDQNPEMNEFLVKDPETGKPHKFMTQYCLDVLNPDMRKWWSDSAADMVFTGDADGIFIDQMHGFAWLHPEEKRGDVRDGVIDMMRQLKQKIGPDKILLANNGAHIPEIFEISDAFMFEHYDLKVTHTKEALLNDWELMEKIADAGKICIYRFSTEPEPNSHLAKYKGGKGRIIDKRDEFAELSKKQLEFYLALYLIGAQPYAYFQWNWAWNINTGPLEHYPELHKPLGKPLAKFTRLYPDKWEFTRHFEHARVWVDTEKRTAKIDWK